MKDFDGCQHEHLYLDRLGYDEGVLVCQDCGGFGMYDVVKWRPKDFVSIINPDETYWPEEVK